MQRFASGRLMRSGFMTVLLIAASSATAAESVAVPGSIETYNVPALSPSLAARLSRYGETRSAFVYGWQDKRLLIGTRFGETNQLHRVAQPLGYREQLTFLAEPLADVSVPRTGAKDKVVISWDVGGSEFDQLYTFDLKSRELKMISDGRSLYGQVLWAPDEQSIVYVTTQRNGRNWDIHRQTFAGAVEKLLETDDGFWYPLSWSADGRRLLIKNRESINVSSIFELDVTTRELKPLLGVGKSVAIEHAAYDGQGNVAFTSDEDSEFLRLRLWTRATGNVEVLTQSIPWNVEAFVFSPQYDKLLYAINEGGLSRLGLLNWPSRKSRRVPDLPQGVLTSLAFAPDGRQVAIGLTSAVAPADVFVADLADRKLTRWTRSEVGGLDQDTFVDVDLIEYPTFDGRKISAFVYRPQTPGPHPVVIYIHGGPEAQYRPYFSTTMQSYVNEMNVAVIAPNVRGSNGYGKSYLRLDNGRLREDSVKDIGALLDWIETQDAYRSDRVAVMGGSYGGYMVLACMVHYGDRLAAAVDSVGISNFVTFLENTQPYRQDMRRVEYGDERDPDMRAFLQSISPLTHVNKMITPVLISQGANDPRVPASESEQIRIALDAAGVPAWYILARDEGHGFRKKVNRDFDRIAKFAFLEKYLLQE